VANVVALAVAFFKHALDIQFPQGRNGVLGGAPRHAGGFHQRGYAGHALVNQVGHVKAAVKAGFCFAERHGEGIFLVMGIPAV
jgi:hypothetical protein